MSVEERIREVRKELAQLQTAEHPAHAEQKRQHYIDALKREYAGAEQLLRIAKTLGDDERETVADPFGGFKLGDRTGRDLVFEAEDRLLDIDAELARAESLSDGDYSRQSGGDGTS